MSEANQNYIRIPLTKGHYALIDMEDYPEISKHRWCYSHGRAMRNSLGDEPAQRTLMHRQILNAPDGVEVDHIDGNPLNNSRANLRLATNLQNARNRGVRNDSSTGSKSVYYTPRVKRGKPWAASIRIHGKLIHLGVFHTKEEAELAYETKAKEIHGEFFRAKAADKFDWSHIPIAPRTPRANQTKSGFRGVYPHHHKWIGMVRHERENIYLGLFPTPELASLAVEAKIKELRP